MSDTSSCTVLNAAGDDARIGAALKTVIPAAVLQRLAPDGLRRLPKAAGLIVTDATQARAARAAGFAGGIVIVGVPCTEPERTAFRMQGTVFVEPNAPIDVFAEALSAAIPCDADGTPSAVPQDVAHTRQLLAAGELAFALQHALTNPLTALMAEVQLLQMDAVSIETRTAANRMLELVRRITEVTRSLDVLRERPGGALPGPDRGN